MMHISAVKSLLSALCQLSHQCMLGTSSGVGLAVSQKIGSITFSVERMISILVNNLHSMYFGLLWQVVQMRSVFVLSGIIIDDAVNPDCFLCHAKTLTVMWKFNSFLFLTRYLSFSYGGDGEVGIWFFLWVFLLY